MPQFSIITICLNEVSKIRETFDSVVQQSFMNYEWIVVDGGSTDGTLDVIREYEDKIQWWCSEPDSGVYNAMNKGVAHATGDYVIFMNGGDCFYDRWVLERLNQIGLFADVIEGNTFEKGNGKRFNHPDGNLARKLIADGICHQSAFIRRSLLVERPYDEHHKIASDWKFWIQVLLCGKATYQFVDMPIARIDMNGLTFSNMDVNLQERAAILDEVLPSSGLSSLSDVLKEYHAMTHDPLVKYTTFLAQHSRKGYHLVRKIAKRVVKVVDKFTQSSQKSALRTAVAIPVYQSRMSVDELSSFRQCLKVLGQHDIFLICPQGLDTSEYEKEASFIRYKRFAPEYFDGIRGYNRLMTSKKVYDSFKDYDYVLIYQLDAWVFQDNLDKWVQKGYDYIGAPWFEHQTDDDWTALKQDAEGRYQLWLTGNGGLSLRRVSAFRNITRPYQRVWTIKEVFSQEYGSLKDLGRCLLLCCGPWLGTNSMRHLVKTDALRVGEDAFFCCTLSKTHLKLSIPSPKEAAFFAFECQPAYLFQHITKGEMPFGCHAWRKYQYEEFWQQFIPVKK